MTEHPILFSGPMVRAILGCSKTQTRRALRDQQPVDLGASTDGTHLARRPVHDHGQHVGTRMAVVRCPYGAPGERLWVRETTIITPKRWNDGAFCTHRDDDGDPRIVQYLATHPDREAAHDYKLKATPSIFMPRWACRLMLEVVAVRCERLQEISEADAKAEGVDPLSITDGGFVTPSGNGYVGAYKRLWDSLNAKRGFGWKVNPWVWVMEFKRA